jgi:hypothetical protein
MEHRFIDNSPTHPTTNIDSLRLADPDLPDLCWNIITGYEPNKSTSAWPPVRRFVIECVIAMRPRTHANARRLMTMTALYVTWVWTVTGCELIPEKVFRNNLVRRYLAEPLAPRSALYRFDTTRQLAAIAEVTGATKIDRLHKPARGPRVRPYTQKEFGALYSWANTLSTSLKRQNARALLALAGGAGLTAQELMAARVEDVTLSDGRVFVTVTGLRARRVPVLATWAKTLIRSVGDRTSGYLFQAFRLDEYPPTALQRFISEHACAPRPSAARLHVGWVVTQINAGLPLPVLLNITGFTSTQTLQPYLEYTTCPPVDDYVGRINGEEVA